MSTGESTAASGPVSDSQKKTLLDVWDRETATTLKVMRAYPEDQAALRPHERAKTALDLAWMFTSEMQLAAAAVQDRLDLSAGWPAAPGSLSEVIAKFESAKRDLMDALRASDLSGTVKFFVAPKTMGDWTKPDFLWFLLHDQIHHRGQFSVYLRMSGAKVPSIYGPSADEPWF